MKTLFVRQCRNSDVKKLNWWPVRSNLVMQVFASLPNILVLSPNALPDALLAVAAVGGASKLCLERCVNFFGPASVLAEKANDDSFVVLHPLREKP
jgi:hypothetical protein